MLSRCKMPWVLYRLATSPTLQTQRHGRIMELRQFCWTRQCLLARQRSTESKPNTQSHRNPSNNLHPRREKKVYQNIHPSAYKVESSNSSRRTETPFPNQPTPDIEEAAFDDAYFKNLRIADKVPASHSLIYMDSHQRFTLTIFTGAKTVFSVLQMMVVRSLYEQWQGMTSLGLETSSIASDPRTVLTALASVFITVAIVLLQVDSRKRIFRIYKEKTQEDKYIAIKSNWVFWTKHHPFTGEEVKYISDWDKSVYGIVAGNFAIKGKRYRMVPTYFKELSLYNDLCGFGKDSFFK
ncbi:uncharacterized protein LOC110454453 [Mizuhopecten yessoensis]|uniref:uncharacterized protein LOC110454453 n=1 Tax=Mizuhopecten yessoensis TaxID=6573 RepID=UPI000B459639|nr:uncharacterized protein LOC110454453 [Mizuhopecten yessoensis]XP_021359633.1 uncharacterized protein LOC110454453 [Mizuhopecten yessoensis]